MHEECKCDSAVLCEAQEARTVNATIQHATCPKCHGTGTYYTTPCPACDGSGKMQSKTGR